MGAHQAEKALWSEVSVSSLMSCAFRDPLGVLRANPDRFLEDHEGEHAAISAQIAGTVPEVMADAARHNVDHGAQIIDINMDCPARCTILSDRTR